jgi:hypothetical protein
MRLKNKRIIHERIKLENKGPGGRFCFVAAGLREPMINHDDRPLAAGSAMKGSAFVYDLITARSSYTSGHFARKCSSTRLYF